MATGLDLSGISQFNPSTDPASVSQRWKDWLKRFQRFIMAMDIKDDTRKRNLLLYLAGPEVDKIFETLPETGENKDYALAVKKLSEYFAPKKNVLYEIHVFRQAKQNQEETLDQFYTRLCQLAQTCEFTDSSAEIKIQLMENCCSSRLRRKALREEITLDELLKYGRSLERSDHQLKAVEEVHHRSTLVNEIQHLRLDTDRRRTYNLSNQSCYFCGDSYPHKNGRKSCPAVDKTCRNCGKSGHFARVCKSQRQANSKQQRFAGRDNDGKRNKHLNAVNQEPGADPVNTSDSDSDSEYAFTLKTEQATDKNRHNTDIHNVNKPKLAKDLPMSTVSIGSARMKVLIDSGASVNILSSQDFDTVNKAKRITLRPTKLKLHAFGSKSPVQLCGKFDTVVETKSKMTVATFYVTKQNSGSLLSCATSTELGILHLKLNTIQKSVRNKTINNNKRAKHAEINTGIKQTQPKCKIPITQNDMASKTPIAHNDIAHKNSIAHENIKAELCDQFPQVFEGIGKLKNYEQSLHIDPQVAPVSQMYRRTPFHLRRQLDVWIDDYLEKDIIEPVKDESTDWVSGLVVAPKPRNPNEVRVCGDYRQVNTAVKRERHPIPTIDELLEDLTDAQKFSKIDLRAGYHQILLTKEARSITTFVTHRGLFRYKRLPFGINSASEVFQNAIQNALRGLEGTRNIADDIILWGRTEKEHNERLQALFKRLHERGLTVNPSKCLFGQDSLWFYGYTLTKDGLKADHEKIEAIQQFTAPENIHELRSFLGLAVYCSRFLQGFATLTQPLRELTKRGVPWVWNNTHQKAFDAIKAAISKDCIMAYYNPQLETQLTVDASPYGLGAILSNIDDKGVVRNVAYASRSLTDTEQRYSQTEREALALVWGCERFHMYLIGTKFQLFTDHKALEILFSPKSKPTARIERWVLRLQQYDFAVKYRTGADNPADILSCMPIPSTTSKLNVADHYVNFVAAHAVPKAMTMADIEEATAKDSTLQKVIQSFRQTHWDTSNVQLKPYARLSDELSITESGVVLRGHRIVMPSALREKTLKIAHHGHQGTVKMKELLRTKVWWPNIDKQVEELIKACLPCQATSIAKPPTPLRITETPTAPWTHLGLIRQERWFLC